MCAKQAMHGQGATGADHQGCFGNHMKLGCTQSPQVVSLTEGPVQWWDALPCFNSRYFGGGVQVEVAGSWLSSKART